MRNYRDLAILASSSAIGIDSHIHGLIKEKNYLHIKELAKELEGLSKEKLSPTCLVMLGEVVWPNIEDWEGKKKDDVYLQTNLFAKDLACFKEFPRERQEELRDVCVELSERSMHYYMGQHLPYSPLINFFN